MGIESRLNKLEAALEPQTNSHKWPYDLPLLTLDTVILALDAARLPDHKAGLESVKAHGGTPDLVADWQVRRDLALCEQLYTGHDIDADTYIRLTTAQPYTSEQLQDMREQLHRRMPLRNGRHRHNGWVYTLLTDRGEIYLTCEQDVWYQHADYPYSIFGPDYPYDGDDRESWQSELRQIDED